MTITRIQKLQGYRIFRDFTWDSLPDFGRYNLIYGWNGAGKTSLSSLFRHLQRKAPPDAGSAEMVIDGKVVTGTGFASNTLPAVRVFNRDFVDRSVFETPGLELPPVFYLGEDSAAKQQQIVVLLALQDELTKNVAALSEEKAKATAELNTFCTNQARSIRNLLLGDPRYNNYEAPKFKELMARISSAEPPESKLDDDVRARLENALAAKPLLKLTLPSLQDIDLIGLTGRVTDELGTTVVASTIQELVDAPDIAGWVQSGLRLHSTAQTHCHFCKQQLEPARLAALEAHFNNRFKAQQDRLSTLESDIRKLRTAARERVVPDRAAVYPHLQTEYDAAVVKLNRHLLFVESYLDGLCRAVEAKKTEPFTELSIYPYLSAFQGGADTGLLKFVEAVVNGVTVVGASSGVAAMKNISELVRLHNEFTDNFEKSVAAVRAQLELEEGIKVFSDWSERQKHAKEVTVAHEAMLERQHPIQEQITILQSEMRQHRPAADELTREMAAYLGRDELRFESKENGYTIMRGGQPAMHLSDGERTAIAFMYFLKTLGDTGFELKNGIVVIDDPVSSLDANSLFCAFGYMRERTKDAKQLFVLTHNFSFFRQVKNWFNFAGNIRNKPYDPGKSATSHFYMLAMKNDDGKRNAYLRTLDPLLHEYESEYHYLFRCVREGAAKDAPQTLAEVYGLPNIARRLLESFLSFRVPGKAGNLAQQMDALSGDAAAKARIVRFLHTHSHMEQVCEPEHDLSVLSEAPAVLADVLTLIEANDKNHYDAMLKIA
ncbi:Wobble nucleotide-excising tRNase [Burkholderia sp. CF099]|nr:Wobble nucleotide-excising tRNase [Burkholderia sp. CF099]